MKTRPVKNYNTKKFWNTVKKEFKKRDYDYFCHGSVAFESEWQKEHKTLKKLAARFLKKNKWLEYFESGKTEAGVLFESYGKARGSMRRDVRFDFIAWNLKRLEK